MKLLFFFIIVFYKAQSLSCNEQYQCLSVTNDYNYIECFNNLCKCRFDLGFSGEATTISKCNCMPPFSVYWKNNIPYCIRYEDAVIYQLNKTRNELLKSKVKELYNNII